MSEETKDAKPKVVSLPAEPKKAPAKSARRGRPTGAVTVAKELEAFFTTLSFPFAVAGDLEAALFVTSKAPELAAAWAKLAEKNPKLKKLILSLTQGSAYGEVVLATASTVIPLAQHYEAIPDSVQIPFVKSFDEVVEEARAELSSK